MFEGKIVEDCSLANLGNDHGFISKEYISIGMKTFGEAQSKAMRADNIIPLWRVVVPKSKKFNKCGGMNLNLEPPRKE